MTVAADEGLNPAAVDPGALAIREPGVGDRTEQVPAGLRRKVFLELTLLWLGTLLAIRGVVAVQALGLPDFVLAAVPFLFIYVPVGLCSWRKVDSYGYRLAIPDFGDRAAWSGAIGLVARVVAIILVPWLIGYHYYQTLLFHAHPAWRIPHDVWLLAPYHLFFVALPEEFFYRGYFQTRLNEVFPRKFLLFGAPFGWGLPIACLYFAFGHSLVTFQWWHFATFFPGLAFGLLRERTGSPLAGALFHAWCNVTVVLLDTAYGIRAV